MAKDFNQIIIVGRLTKDPEVRYTGNNIKHVKFTIANSDDYKQGETKVDRTYFINCEAYGSTGDVIEKYAFKGKQVLVNGKMYVRETEREGNRTWYSGVIVNSVQLLQEPRERKGEQTKVVEPEAEQVEQPKESVQQPLITPEAFKPDEEAREVEIPF